MNSGLLPVSDSHLFILFVILSICFSYLHTFASSLLCIPILLLGSTMARTKAVRPVKLIHSTLAHEYKDVSNPAFAKKKPFNKKKGAVGVEASTGFPLKPRKKHRFRPGTVALRDIRKYQRSVEFLIRRAPFIRVVREIAQDFKNETRWTKTALESMQEAAEAYLVRLLSDAYHVTLARGRVSLCPIDVQVVRFLRNETQEKVHFGSKWITMRRGASHKSKPVTMTEKLTLMEPVFEQSTEMADSEPSVPEDMEASSEPFVPEDMEASSEPFVPEAMEASVSEE